MSTGGAAIPIVVAADLESRLDRHRLLVDEAYRPPYWALLWSGARMLAEHVATRVDCRGLEVLDVGCGLGLTALASALGGARVTAIDREAAPLDFLRVSAALNRVDLELRAIDVSTLPSSGRFDLILCAELLYEADAFDDLASSLARLLADGGRVLLTDARRMDTGPFWAAVQGASFIVREIARADVVEETSRVTIRLVELVRGS